MTDQLRLYSTTVYELQAKTGLTAGTVKELLDRGWTLEENEGEPNRWVSPHAQLPAHIPHHEPRCEDECMNFAPHVHGLKCDRNCKECKGVCHPDCPAHKKED